MRELVFGLGFATFIAHELDAVARAEWRILPLIRDLSETSGYATFVLAHIPLLAALIWVCWSSNRRTQTIGRLFVAAFMIIHVVLHLMFVDHPDYQFNTILSQGLIYGAGVLGLLYLLTSLSLRRSP